MCPRCHGTSLAKLRAVLLGGWVGLSTGSREVGAGAMGNGLHSGQLRVRFSYHVCALAHDGRLPWLDVRWCLRARSPATGQPLPLMVSGSVHVSEQHLRSWGCYGG